MIYTNTYGKTLNTQLLLVESHPSAHTRLSQWTMYISGFTIIKIILLGLVILSTYLNIQSAFFTGKTETVMSTRNLSDMEFPVIFKLSVHGLLNITRIMKTHQNVGSYFNGIGEGNIPQFHWTDRNGRKTVQGTQLNNFNTIYFSFFRNFRE